MGNGVPPTTRKPRFPRNMASYQALVDAFRQAPGNFSAAAALTGFTRAACKFAWEKGWERVGLAGVGPIRDVIKTDQERARLAAAEAARKERDLADAEVARKRAEAVKALEDEALLLTTNRKALLSLSGTVDKMIGILPLYALRIQEAVAQPDPNDPKKLIPIQNPNISIELAMTVIQGISLSAQRVAYSTSRLVELAKADRKTTETVAPEADLSEPVEVLEEIRAAATLFDRLSAARDEAEVEPHPTVQ